MSIADLYSLPLVQSLVARYQALSAKDQVAVKYLGMFFIVIFLVYGVIKPIANYSDKAQARYINAQADLTWLINNAPKNIGQVAQRDPSVSLLSVASSTANKYYVSFSRYEAQDESTLKVNFDRVLFKNLILWLENMEKNHGVSIFSISAQEQDASGYVSARVVLKG